MTSHPFTLRSEADLLATFRSQDQESVVLPKHALYPVPVEHYYAWTEPSGVYTYIIFKRPDWEVPMGLVFQRNGSGSHFGPAGMCEWCHTPGASDEVGLLTTTVNRKLSGGTWLCLDLSCTQKIEERTGMGGANTERQTQKLCQRIGDFFKRVRLEG
jgi:hypothetical protein